MQLLTIHRKHIEGSSRGAFVTPLTLHLSTTTKEISRVLGVEVAKVYISTRVLKHMYDKRPTCEYFMLIGALPQTIQYPDKIITNLDTKSGDYIFLKTHNGCICTCSLQNKHQDGKLIMEVVTSFELRIQKAENYLKKYKIMWSRRSGTSSS